MADVGTLAAQAAERIPGIPWSSLRAGGILNPEYDQTYIQQYLIPAAEAAGRIVDQYQLLLTKREIDEIGSLDEARAWRRAMEAVEGQADAVEAASRAGASSLSAADAIKMPQAALRMNLYTAYHTALYSVVLHTGVTLHHGVAVAVERGDVYAGDAAALIRRHADATYRTLKAIAALDRYGVLKLLPRRGSVAGLGAIPGVVMIAIAGVVAVVVLAGMLYWMKESADLNQRALGAVEKMCREAQERRDQRTVRECIDKLSNPNRGISEALARAGEQLGKWLVIGALVVGAVYFAPLVVRRLGKARKEIRRAS